MRYLVYDLLLHILIIFLSPYYLLKMIFSGKYRAGLTERFGFLGDKAVALEGGDRVVWFHAVSVGETRAALPLVRRFKEAYPDSKIVFSTVTATGQAVAARDESGLIDMLIYMPLDLSWVVRGVLSRIKPSLFVIVEKEYWPGIINALRKRGCAVAVVNGSISEKSFRSYKRLAIFFAPLFNSISLFSARTGGDASKAGALGVGSDRIFVTGNIKFDMEAAPDLEARVEGLKKALGIKDTDKVVVAGSTHRGEEEIMIEVYRSLEEKGVRAKFLIAPRHPERFTEVSELLAQSGVPYIKRSEATGAVSGKEAGIILLDTLGELFYAYGLGSVAFVGGSLVEIGGHNLLEPAYFGVPVLYGPHITSCEDMAELLEGAGAGRSVTGKRELAEALMELLSDDKLISETGENACTLLESIKGTTVKTVRLLGGLMK